LIGLEEMLSSSSDRHCFNSMGSSVNELCEISRTTSVGARTRRKAGRRSTRPFPHLDRRRWVMPKCQLRRMRSDVDLPEKVEISFSEIDSIPPISLN
jgi:hypothetical protein